MHIDTQTRLHSASDICTHAPPYARACSISSSLPHPHALHIGENTSEQETRENVLVFPGEADARIFQMGSKSGLCMGGNTLNAALFIDESLERGRTLPSMAFRNPSLIQHESSFDVRHLEVWLIETEEDALERECERATLSDDGEDPNAAYAEDLARFRGTKKDSVLKNGVERFMLSFVGHGSAVQQAMHVRNNS
eukprot:CAMPEP_0179445780 /NCGR_PEP_ID=MMETSP0799-20121207/29228_1 /TAXON_ID=46947 /ORGANISM="Geminigera cryophila, Strain CCMP2564" /LENGTH=194 /DNA_ID=CAMNT_0021234169 /DNA_START=70 /DNA_END=654 /DNA_ORIENTATION=+